MSGVVVVLVQSGELIGSRVGVVVQVCDRQRQREEKQAHDEEGRLARFMYQLNR